MSERVNGFFVLLRKLGYGARQRPTSDRFGAFDMAWIDASSVTMVHPLTPPEVNVGPEVVPEACVLFFNDKESVIVAGSAEEILGLFNEAKRNAPKGGAIPPD